MIRRMPIIAGLLAAALASGCATVNRYGSLAADDARAVFRERPGTPTLIAAGTVVASALADETVRNAARRNRGPRADDASEVIGPFGGRYSDRVVAGFLVAGLAMKNDTMKAVAFDSFVSSLVASKVVTPLLKGVAQRDRPNESDGAFEFDGGSSFPSNHATQAFAVASVIAAHSGSRWVDGAAYGIAALVGASRIYDDAHWLSDVVAGAFIGTATGRLIVRTNDRSRTRWTIAPIYDEKRRGIAIRTTR
jgi:membrane-associated phospholipid phosphatase